MNKLPIIIFFSFLFINISAQTENNENSDEEEIIHYLPASDESEVLNVPSTKSKPSPSSREFLKLGNNRKLYKIHPLYKGFDWIETKKEKNVGVIKDGKFFLPLVFHAKTNQKGSQIILGYKKRQGVYDLDLDKWIIPTVSDWIIKLNPDLFVVRMFDGLFRLVNSKNEILEKTNWIRFDQSSINSNHYIVKTRDNLFGLYDKKLKKIIFEPNHKGFKIENGHYLISKNGMEKNILNSDGIFLFDDWVEDIQKVVDPNTRKRPRYFGGLDAKFDYYIVKKDEKKGLVRSDSKVVLPFEYQDILYRGYFWSQNEVGKWGVTNGEKNIIPFNYDEIFRLANVRTKANFFQLLKVRIGGKFGLYQYNPNSLNLLAECNYTNVKIESHGVIVQYPDNKYQLINYDTKKPVFKNKKDEIIQSYQSSLIVKDRNNWSLVTPKGVNRTKQVYKYLQNFHFYIIAQNSSGKFGILTNKGKTILPFEYENIFFLDEDKSAANIFIIKKGGKYGLFNASKKQIKTEIIYDNIFKDSQYIYLSKGDDFFEARAYGGGDIKKRENFIPAKKETEIAKNLSIVKFTPGYKTIFGLYNFKTKDWILPLGYKNIIEIKEDLFLIKKNNEPVSFINAKGKLVRKTDWIELSSAKYLKNEVEHYYFKNSAGLTGIYDAISNKEIIPPVYEKINIDSNVDNKYFLKKEGRSNYADYDGNLMFPDDDLEIIKRIQTSSTLKYFTFKKNGEIGLIRSDGKIIVSQNFSNAKITSKTIWLQNSNGKWGFLNQENDQVLFEFDEFKLANSKEGKNYFQVKKDEKVAIFVEDKGTLTLFFGYNYKSIKFLSNLIIIETSNGYRFLDYSKKDIFEREFQEFRKFHKYYFVKFNDQWSLVNSKGEKIIEESFEDLDNFSQKNSTQYDKKYFAKYKAANQKFGLLSTKGEKLTEPIFDDIVYRLNGYIIVKNKGKLRWYNPFENEYASDLEFDYFSDNTKNVYCSSKDKWYYTGKFSDKFYFKEMELPTSTNH